MFKFESRKYFFDISLILIFQNARSGRRKIRGYYRHREHKKSDFFPDFFFNVSMQKKTKFHKNPLRNVGGDIKLRFLLRDIDI